MLPTSSGKSSKNSAGVRVARVTSRLFGNIRSVATNPRRQLIIIVLLMAAGIASAGYYARGRSPRVAEVLGVNNVPGIVGDAPALASVPPATESVPPQRSPRTNSGGAHTTRSTAALSQGAASSATDLPPGSGAATNELASSVSGATGLAASYGVVRDVVLSMPMGATSYSGGLLADGDAEVLWAPGSPAVLWESDYIAGKLPAPAVLVLQSSSQLRLRTLPYRIDVDPLAVHVGDVFSFIVNVSEWNTYATITVKIVEPQAARVVRQTTP